MSLTNRFDRLKQFFTRDSEGEFEQGPELNQSNTKRNRAITISVFVVLFAISAAYYFIAIAKPGKAVKETPKAEFGTLIEDDFTSKDNQSALALQQSQIEDMNAELEKLAKLRKYVEEELEKGKKDLKKKADAIDAAVKSEVQRQVDVIKEQMNVPTANTEANAGQSNETEQVEHTVNGQGSVFGQQPLPPKPMPVSDKNPNMEQMSYSRSQESKFQIPAIDSFDFVWDEGENNSYRRTVDNYVPTGSFVTAVVTGGADANAGVLGQGDTSPIVFQTIDEGFLPNGQKSHLKNCTITGAVYGELSSERGISRTNRMSCIFPNGDILDIPVKGTAFNFGRNGIRGTAILKNGKIVQMAGISGIVTGIGETGKALSQTTSTSALGATTTIDGQKAALNILGSATSSVGAKLADYYIKLAEQYHPIIELNPGNVVNIVFLEGFPLDPIEAEKYAQTKADEETQQSATNSVLDVITGAVGSNPVTKAAENNPLAKKVTDQVLKGAGSSPFGIAQ